MHFAWIQVQIGLGESNARKRRELGDCAADTYRTAREVRPWRDTYSNLTAIIAKEKLQHPAMHRCSRGLMQLFHLSPCRAMLHMCGEKCCSDLIGSGAKFIG